VKAFEESADGSAFIFLRWFKVAQSVGLFKLRLLTKVASKRTNQANYFYRTSISRTTTHPQYWYLIHIKSLIINFFYSIMKVSLPISTFNDHAYFFATSEKLLHENMHKTLRTTQNVFSNGRKSKPSGKKAVPFLMRIVASKVWCYIQATTTCKNRHHVICDLAHGSEHNFSKIVMIKQINHLTFGIAVSGKNVNQRKFFSTPTLLV